MAKGKGFTAYGTGRKSHHINNWKKSNNKRNEFMRWLREQEWHLKE
jgi:hypothetical protein